MKRLSALFLYLAAVNVWAQAPIPQSVNAQCGAVYSMVQDTKGYLWLGTEKGLIRYDGLHFKTYSTANGSVSDLRIDKSGAICCQNFSGKHYIFKNDTLVVNTTLPTSGKLMPVTKSKADVCYWLGYKQVFAYGSRWDTIPFRNEIYGIYNYKDKTYAYDSDSVHVINSPAAKSFKHMLPLSDETVYFNAVLFDSVLVFPRNLKQKKVYALMPEPRQLTAELPEVLIQSVNIIRDSLVFVSTNNGLYVLNRQLKQLPIKQPLLYNKSISGVLAGTDGNIWVSTTYNGLFKFECFDCIATLSEEPVLTLSNIQPDGTFLYGTNTGKVYTWQPTGKSTLWYQSKRRQQIVALYKDYSGKLMLCGDAFSVLNGNSAGIEVLLAVKDIVPLSANEFALARTGGVSLLSFDKAKFDEKKHKMVLEQADYIIYEKYIINNTNLRAKSVVYDSLHNIIYAATSIGLLQLNENNWTSCMVNGSTLHADDMAIRNDTLFAVSGTQLHLIKNGKSLANYKIAIHKEVFSALRVSNNAIWLSSGTKMYRIKSTYKGADVFELTNGEEINDFMVTAQRLIITTDAGLSTVMIHDLAAEKPKLQLHLTHMLAGDRRLNYQRQNILTHNDNNLKLTFSIPYYTSDANLRIQYRINERPWQLLENGQRELSLISLEPGKYVIRIKASAPDGRATDEEVVRLTIRPPFWNTWWFYIASLLTVATGAYLLYRYRLNLVQKQNALEKQKIELENKLRDSILASVKAQMNPHFIFNALNTIQSFIYLNDKKNATSYLGKFSQLTRTILDMSNKNMVNLAEEIDAILLYLELERMRFDEEMDFSIEVAPEINKEAVRIPPMIIQPYLENAVKHGLLHQKGNRWLKCHFELSDKLLKVTIDDNGIGRARSQELNKIKNKQHQSFATQANEKRLNALNRGTAATVSVQYTDKFSLQGEAMGTTVVLLIALQEID